MPQWLIPAVQDWLNIRKSINVINDINRLKKKKKSHDHINWLKKKFDKTQHPLMKKTFSKLEIEASCLNFHRCKEHVQKTYTAIFLKKQTYS